MDFKNLILDYEYEDFEDIYLLKIGSIPVLLTAVHTMKQTREDGTIKLNEPFTKAICRYVSDKIGASCFIKIKDTGIDSNSLDVDEYKEKLIKIISDNDIKLVLDLHGASSDKDFDVEFGTLDNLSAKYLTIKKLEKSFYKNGITNIKFNDPFKGGGVTQYIYSETDIDAIQLEINRNFRDVEEIDKLKSVCDSIVDFIKLYLNFN